MMALITAPTLHAMPVVKLSNSNLRQVLQMVVAGSFCNLNIRFVLQIKRQGRFELINILNGFCM